MKLTRDPRASKDKDLSSHCRNCYGNSDKAARRGVRRKKRVTARGARRDDTQLLTEIAKATDPDDDDCARLVRRKLGWNQKWPDQPLGEILQRKVERLIWQGFTTTAGTAGRIECFIAWSARELQVPPLKQEAWRRFLRGCWTARGENRTILTTAGRSELRQAVTAWTRRG